MPRPPRIQFPGANYHLITRGDGRQKLFHDQGHYERFTKGLEEEVQRCGWIVLSFCWMPNHIHALIQTPQPNLATGMQHWLSGYANWYAKRNRRTGHLFKENLREWVFGSEDFLRRMVALAEGSRPNRHQSTSRRLRTVSMQEILRATALEHGVEPSDYSGFRSPAAGRDMAAWLCRRWTGSTLAELGPAFGLAGTDSVSNLVRRAEKRYQESATWQETAAKIETALGLNTDNKA